MANVDERAGGACVGRRPSYSRKQLDCVNGLIGNQEPIARIAKVGGLERQAIYRVKGDPAAADRVLARWEE